jgi:hypothetical protein
MEVGQVRIAIAGMHRSGTSMFAHFLHESGVYLGERLYQNEIDNPYGHYEDEDFIELHQKETEKYGVEFEYLVKDVFSPSQSWRVAAEKLYYEKRKKNQEKAIWGWKEPRTALFLEDWNSIDPKLQFVFIFREPTAVISSLCKRHGKFYSPQFISLFYKVYMAYNQSIAKFIQKNLNFTLISYESLVTRPKDALNVLSEDLHHDFNVAAFERVFDSELLNKKRKVWPIMAVPQKRKAEELYSMLKMQQSF